MRYILPKQVVIPMLFFMLASCSKPDMSITSQGNNSSFDQYLIRKGNHFSDQGAYTTTELSELRFLVKFDSTAIYTTTIPDNQYDINKLYGFADNSGHHHQFSARIGWRWSDGALRLFGYVYNNSIISYEEITAISIGSEQDCTIKVTDTSYIFIVDGKITIMPRAGTGAIAKGYKLFPYFGGDETAPHDIHIRIKEK
jgi:hypothetical protein